MVMKPDVWGRALDAIAVDQPTLVVPTPAGKKFTQPTAARLARAEHLVFACGRYEGIDQRVIIDAAGRMPVLELSIGDYVLAGGEAAVLVMIEAIARLIPGVLGNPDSAGDDSFSGELADLLEAPSYTRPAVFRGLPVPAVLTSGDHAAVAAYRHAESLRRTAENRPDLLDRVVP
jgi:tRNA (guanine37-N1)-methyltransferase